MRSVFSTELVAAAERDERVVVLSGDHGYALFDELRRHRPQQFINAGVAEQNMVGVAAGLAKAGLRPIVYGLSAFVPIRVYEQVKLDVCYENLPVVFVGDGAGMVYGTLGASHQSCEDVAALRALPNLTIYSPADGPEMQSCFRAATASTGPVYLRMGKADLGDVHSSAPRLSGGQPLCVTTGQGLALIATGSMVRTAVATAATAEFAQASVWSVPCLKPIDENAITDICRRHEVIVVLEEHSTFGGLGSAVAEIAASHAPTWVCRIGAEDRFNEECGSYSHLMRSHGLDVEGVCRQIRSFLHRMRAAPDTDGLVATIQLAATTGA
jgi:transketolase